MAPAELAVLQWVEELAQAPARHDLLPRRPAVLPKLMSLALSVLDLRYAGPQLPGTSAFHAQFLRLGMRISANIARAWCCPEGVGLALDTLGTQPAPQPSPRLAVLLRSADQVSKRHLLSTCQAEPVVSDDAAGHESAACHAELQRVFGTDHAAALSMA